MKQENIPALITDGQRLVGAKSRFGHPIPVYDDGFGSLYVHRDSMGISGIVRAVLWEDAYGICEDEFFPEASETIEELQKEYGFKRETVKLIHPLSESGASIDYSVTRPDTSADYERNGGKLLEGQFVEWKTTETSDADAWMENELFQEAYGFRPNGPNSKDKNKHGIYAKDLNGDWLDTLTPELLAELDITLEIENED